MRSHSAPSQPGGKQHHPAMQNDAGESSLLFPGRYSMPEANATVEQFENGRSFSLWVHQATKPRTT